MADDKVSINGPCSICEKPAKTRCANCKAIFYCDKEHQRSDWPKHKSVCYAYEERDEGSELGRFLVAARDLKPGDLVISETPLVWGPRHHSDDRVCVGCGIVNAVCRCPGCGWPACEFACPGLVANGSPHVEECAILGSAGARLLPRCEYLLALRMLIMRRRHPKRWETLTRLQSHEKLRGPGTDAYEENENMVEYFDPIFRLDPSLKGLLEKISGLIDVNALETNPPEGSVAIYKTACLLEHRCIANTRHVFQIDDQGRPKISVFAATDIKKGEHLSTTYTHVLWSTLARREHLMATKYFACKCERCADPTELGSNIGTLRCPCANGFMTPNDPLNFETEWSCKACPGVLSSSEVSQLCDRLGEEVEGAMARPDREKLLDLLFRLNVLLHPSHQHCLTIGHSLMQMLSPEDPKKAEICQRIINAIAIVDPHNSRIPLYKAIALRELAKCSGQDKTALLMSAVEALKYEPPNSPGDKFVQILVSEM